MSDLTPQIARILDQVRPSGEPNWAPLEAAIPAGQLSGWMWMGTVSTSRGPIEAYKHGISRHYLHLDHAGNVYRYHHPSGASEGVYRRSELETELAFAYENLALYNATPETSYDLDYIAERSRLLREAGIEVVM